jgi:ribosomal protein S12 methylthiotransferase accessory factor
LRDAVSPYTGVVASVEESLAGTSEPPLFRFACEVAHGAELLGSSIEHVTGVGGSGRTRAAAVAAAVGEALERYSASFVPLDRIVRASAADLGDEAVSPARFCLFSQRQYDARGFPFARFDERIVVPWIDGRSLDDGRRVYLPAELVLLGDVVEAGARRIGYATSNGVACADGEDEAVARGLAELLERDAFMIAWANRLSLPLLDVSADPALAELDARLFARTGLPYAAVDLSCFHRLPSLLGVVRAPRGYPGALGVGAGTAPTVEGAWWKCLAEAFSCRAAGAKLLALDPDRDYGHDGRNVASFEDHIRFYADHERAAAAGFLDASEERRVPAEIPALDASTPSARTPALAERVRRAGSTAYVVDVTSPDVRELGLVVTSTLAPELVPLDVPHAARFLGGSRLYDVPVQLGLRARPLAECELNPRPHPFP